MNYLEQARILRPIIEAAVQSLSDSESLEAVSLHPAWTSMIGKTVKQAGFRFQYGGKLHKTIPENHTFSAHWVPGVGTESLYTRIDETHDGSRYDPIPYHGNMALENGKYYSQGTVNQVYNPLHELVGIYV